MKSPLIFTILLTLTAPYVVAQEADRYAYHSSIEEEVISSFLSDKASNTYELQLISDKNLVKEDIAEVKDRLGLFISDLQKKQGKYSSNRRFLSYMFYKVHRKLLKNYQPFTSFRTLLRDGDYDCLSGTTLYALLLRELGINFEIVETNYHIYVKIDGVDGEQFLIESTDPLSGFIYDQKEIDERLSKYESDNAGNSDSYRFETKRHDAIDLIGLAGLHYFNAAVNTYNKQNLKAALVLFEKATIFYNSPRTEEFGNVLIQTLISSDQFSATQKRELIERIADITTDRVVSTF